MRRNLLATVLGAPLIAVFVYVGAAAAADATLEYDVKAAFLLNFTKFVEWPAEAFDGPRAPLEICVLGKDPFGRSLDDVLQEQSAGDRRLSIRRIQQPPALQTCQVLFLSADVKNASRILQSLPAGILTVGEGDSFLREGGMVAFVLENRHVRFDIHQSAAEKSGLRMSAKLLTVARSVTR